MNTETPQLEPLYDDLDVRLLSERVSTCHAKLVEMRSKYEQERGQLQERIAELEQQLAEAHESNNAIMGIGSPHLDRFSERELERYSQLSPPEMFALLLNREKELAEAWEPLPLGYTHEHPDWATTQNIRLCQRRQKEKPNSQPEYYCSQ